MRIEAKSICAIAAVGGLSGIVIGCAADGPASGPVGAAHQGILGGTQDTLDSAVVGILARHQDNVGVYYALCSGSLIAPNLVLTARHCVADNPDEIECSASQFGATDTPDLEHLTPDYDGPAAAAPAFSFSNGNWFTAEAIVTSPDSSFCGNDIALVRLPGGGIPSELATPIAPRIDAPPVGDEPYRAVGFGANAAGGEGLGVRRQLDNQRVACVGTCPAYLDNQREWEGGLGTCIGDSGGPALDSQGRVIGVSSRSDPDCTGSIYSAVHAWSDWLVQQAVEASALGGYPVPAWAGGAGSYPGTGGSAFGGQTAAGGNTSGGPLGTGGAAVGGQDSEPASMADDIEMSDAGSCALGSAPGGRGRPSCAALGTVVLGLLRRRRGGRS